jgi:hypothetical protein
VTLILLRNDDALRILNRFCQCGKAAEGILVEKIKSVILDILCLRYPIDSQVKCLTHTVENHSLHQTEAFSGNTMRIINS